MPTNTLLKRTSLPIKILLVGSTFYSSSSQADCDNYIPGSGQIVTCTSSAPNPTTTNIAALAGSSNVVVNILSGSSLTILRSTNPVAVSVISSSQITNKGTVSLSGGGGTGTNRGAALLAQSNDNVLINDLSGIITTSGAYNDGMAANGSGNTLINNGAITTNGPNAYGLSAAWGQTGGGQPNNTLENTGTITTNGSNARAASILGQNGMIINSGTLLTTGSSSNGAYLQGNNDALINSGLIHTTGSASSAVFSNTAGSSFTARIENNFGGQIISDQAEAIRTLNGATVIVNAGLLQGGGGTAINGGGGPISLILQTGSTIVGLANGGGIGNKVTLEGAGEITNDFINFQTLYMTGDDWLWTGTATFNDSYMQTGQFRLQNSFTGNVTISSDASLLAGNNAHPSITPNLSGPPITVTNAGLIDLTNGSGAGANSLTIEGNYIGNNGIARLHTVLESDNAPSDQLILSTGTSTGITRLDIINLGGAGDVTTQDGIMVIKAINGATTDDAFKLNAPVAAGAYEYLLFKGGETASTTENWYLRSTSNSVEPLVPPTPGATLTPTNTPIYRVETSLYSTVTPVLRQTGIALLSTFHQRRGEQRILIPAAPLHETWLRVFGQHNKQHWSGTVSPSYDGTLFGFQAGIDLLATQSAANHRIHAGFLAGASQSNSDVKGNALGWNNYATGKLNFSGATFGAYWTYLNPQNGYLDAVIMNNWFDGRTKSTRNIEADIDNTSFITSLEGGYPIRLMPKLILEPQGQIIWQKLPSNNQHDLFSHISFASDSGFTGRLGARLQSNLETSRGLFQPYLKANLWHNFSNINTVNLNTTPIITNNQENALQLGGGLVHDVSQSISAFATADYTFNLSHEEIQVWAGNVGLRMNWG